MNRRDLTDVAVLGCGCVFGDHEPTQAFVIIPHAPDCVWYTYVIGESRRQGKPMTVEQETP